MKSVQHKGHVDMKASYPHELPAASQASEEGRRLKKKKKKIDEVTMTAKKQTGNTFMGN